MGKEFFFFTENLLTIVKQFSGLTRSTEWAECGKTFCLLFPILTWMLDDIIIISTQTMRRTSNIKSVKCSRTLKLTWTLHPSLSDMPQNSLQGVFAQWVQLYIYAEFHTNCQNVNIEWKRRMWRWKNLNIWNFSGSFTIKWMEPLRWVIFISAS